MAKPEPATVTDADFEFVETPKFVQPNFEKQENYGVPTTKVRDT